MVNLLQLKKYSEQTNNNQALSIIKKYTKLTEEKWTNGKYYLGGQLPLDITENITDDNLKFVEQKQNKNFSEGPCNQWELASMQRSEYEFNIIKSLIHSYTQMLRMNGLLRVIVFWLSPARKRAAEKVFHPSNMTFNAIEELTKGECQLKKKNKRKERLDAIFRVVI